MLVTLFQRSRRQGYGAACTALRTALAAGYRTNHGDRPEGLARGALVDVMQADGRQLAQMEAWGVDWKFTGSGTDVVAWRPASRLVGMGGLIDG